MNILFVQDVIINPNAGGLERVTYVLSKELARRGHVINYLCIGRIGEDLLSKKYTEFKQWSISLFDKTENVFLTDYRELLINLKIDIVIFQDIGNANIRVLKLTPSNVIKYVVFHNQPFAHLGKEKKIMSLTPFEGLSAKRKLLKLICSFSPRMYSRLYRDHLSIYYYEIAKHADRFIMLDEKYTDRIIANSKSLIDIKKIDAIVNPITFSPNNKTVKKENIILFVGRLTNPQKNVTGFLDVWSVLRTKLPHWKAIVLGDGEHREASEAYMRKAKLDNIEFKGNVENIADYYAKSKILCMTSSYEGWPMVLMEAMSFGCVPVVYDTFEAVHNIVDNGENGLVVPMFETSRMVEAILSLANEENVRIKLSVNGKNKLKSFTAEKIVDYWEQRFHEDYWTKN